MPNNAGENTDWLWWMCLCMLTCRQWDGSLLACVKSERGAALTSSIVSRSACCQPCHSRCRRSKKLSRSTQVPRKSPHVRLRNSSCVILTGKIHLFFVLDVNLFLVVVALLLTCSYLVQHECVCFFYTCTAVIVVLMRDWKFMTTLQLIALHLL